MIVFLLWLALAGLVVGALGRLVVPGPDPMGIGLTILIGVGGGLIAGLISHAIWGPRYGPGLLLSVACAAVLVLIARGSRGYT
jgi:uncharacterized membrane protein YeaQ/YmgE (transglycosylase-associated protein family)